MFNLGSTIVIFFEANSEIKWLKNIGEFVRYGEPVC